MLKESITVSYNKFLVLQQHVHGGVFEVMSAKQSECKEWKVSDQEYVF